jgi:hypothetical protein
MDLKLKIIWICMLIMIVSSVSASYEVQKAYYSTFTDSDTVTWVNHVPDFNLNSSVRKLTGNEHEINDNKLSVSSGLSVIGVLSSTDLNMSQWIEWSTIWYNDGNQLNIFTYDKGVTAWNVNNMGVRCVFNGLGSNEMKCYSTSASNLKTCDIANEKYYNITILVNPSGVNYTIILSEVDGYGGGNPNEICMNTNGYMRDATSSKLRDFGFESWAGNSIIDNIMVTLWDNGTKPTPPLTPPAITITSPLNNTGFISSSAYMNISDSSGINVSCLLMYNNSIKQEFNFTTSTTINFNLDEEGVNDYSVLCYNDDGNDTAHIRYFLDSVAPIITIHSPNNNTMSNYIDIECNDDNLFALYVELSNNDTIYYNFNITAINTTSYRHSFSVPGNVSRDYHYINVRCADSHTTTSLNRDWNIEKTTDSIDFGGFKIKERENNYISDVEYKREIDRYTFTLIDNSINIGVKNYMLDVTSPYKIYEVSSKYKGHLVAGDYWLDFEPYNVKITRLNDHHIIVSVLTDDRILKFTSTGELNIISKQHIFFNNLHPLIINIYKQDLYQSEKEYTSIILNLSVSNSSVIQNCSFYLDSVVIGENVTVNGTVTSFLLSQLPNGTSTINVTCREYVFSSIYETSRLFNISINTSYIQPSLYDNLTGLIPNEVARDIDISSTPGVLIIALLICICFGFMMVGEFVKINGFTFCMYSMALFGFFISGVLIYSHISVMFGYMMFLMIFPIFIRLFVLAMYGE